MVAAAGRGPAAPPIAMDTPRSIVAHLLARSLPLADLAAATGTSLPTLRRAVHELQAGGWVRIVGRAAATGGRPANLFGVDPDVHTVVGVHLEHPGMRLVATDLGGEPLDESVPDVETLEPDAVHAIVLGYLERLRARFPRRRLLGIGIASPGFIDAQTGTVIAIGRVPSWRHLPLPQRLAEASGMRVTIGNDIDAMAALEFGANGETRTTAYVGFSEGVKFSLFLQGKPYVGAFGNTGLVNPRLLAACAGRAEAADLLTVHGLSERYLARAAAGSSPTGGAAAAGAAQAAGAARVRSLADARERFLAVLAVAEEGEPQAAELVGWMAELLAAQIAVFVLLVQPELLVLGGALAGAPERLLADVEAAVRRQVPTLLNNHLVVRRARTLTPNAAALGAARVFLQRLLAEDGPPLASLGR